MTSKAQNMGRGVLHSHLWTENHLQTENQKASSGFNDTIDQLDLIDIYRTLHPITAECTFFANAHGTFSRIDHMLSHKTNLNKLNRLEMILSIFSDYDSIKLEINYRKKNGKRTNT